MTTQDTENQAGGAETVEETVTGGIVGGADSVEGGSAETTEETESKSDEDKKDETEAA